MIQIPDLQSIWSAAALLLMAATAFSNHAVQAQNAAVAPKKETPKVVAYVPNWIDLDAFVPTIDYSKITHINIAFENPTNDGGDFSFNRKNEVLIAKAHENKVAVLVSIGGGSASQDKT